MKILSGPLEALGTTRSTDLQRLAFDPHGTLICPLLASGSAMDIYSPQQPQQLKDLADCRRRKFPIEDRSATSKKMRRDCKKENNITVTNNDTSNSTFSSHGRLGSTRRSRSPRQGLEPLTSETHKTLLSSAAASRQHNLAAPQRAKAVNWRLACFMAREYLSHGTLLTKPWPPHDSNAATLISSSRENTSTATAKSVSRPLPCTYDNMEEKETLPREKKGLYSILTTDFLRSDDVHIPGIVNPSQLAAWAGFK